MLSKVVRHHLVLCPHLVVAVVIFEHLLAMVMLIAIFSWCEALNIMDG